MTDVKDWHWEDVGGGFMKKVPNDEASVSPHQPYTKAYCLTREDYHEREAASAKRDLEVALAEYPQREYLVYLFTHRHKEHTRYAEAWREAVEDAPE